MLTHLTFRMPRLALASKYTPQTLTDTTELRPLFHPKHRRPTQPPPLAGTPQTTLSARISSRAWTPPPHYNTRHHLTTIIPDTPTPSQYQTPPIVHQDTPTPQQYQTPPIVHQDTPTPQQYQTPPYHNNTRHPHTTCG
ncbi:hypothetical protein Pcinc_012993 [Petrolisthes cinctipes]|uniref:Uncharacterized protein n=1 Tax=Petrolisthes cinctipes TaxID=88211 RepID=A0AAE1KS08_PETCI|nr:hypothetical protein Pcinc_012993 [Petrolisthes cinctipes]